MKTDMNTTDNSARAALRDHQQRLADLNSRSRALESRIEAFDGTLRAGTAAGTRLAALRAKRGLALAAVAMQESDEGELDSLDAEIVHAEGHARRAERNNEIAAAGAARLRVQRDALTLESGTEARKGAALRYHAGTEMIVEAMPAYHAALVALLDAHARLTAACAAADTYADPTASRPYTRPNVDPVFQAPLPSLQGLDISAWQFDGTAKVAEYTRASLSALG